MKTKEQYEWRLKEEEDEIEVEPSPPNERNSGKEQSVKGEEIEQFKNSSKHYITRSGRISKPPQRFNCN